MLAQLFLKNVGPTVFKMLQYFCSELSSSGRVGEEGEKEENEVKMGLGGLEVSTPIYLS
jgi:hypothetical protein